MVEMCCPASLKHLHMPTLRLLLGDQLNSRHSWYQTPAAEDDALYVLMEMRSETDYVRHHIQKVVGFFLAMRHFADQLRAQGRRLRYLTLDDPCNTHTLAGNLHRLIAEYKADRFEYQLPDEYRLDQALRDFCATLPIPSQAFDTEHFLSSREDVAELFRGKKTYLMETFYRAMRKRYQLLMEPDGQTPLTGRWNYDEENRQSLPNGVAIPPVPGFTRDVSELVEMLQQGGVATLGRLNPAHFNWPTSREESLVILDHFIHHRLYAFGAYQDAMTIGHTLLFHSRLSFSLNVKLLHPLEVVEACIDYWKSHPGEVGFAQIEGFIRQIVGWREYMRGVYWARMPAYAGLNFFGHEAPLPNFYWTGNTRMRCLAHAIGQSLDHAYAHHIQRLMVTGNFALLLGVHPDEVDAWYLGIYMDAIEWVEITNTRGMSQFADGGLLATKPYVASANYMAKMGDYCRNCYYDPKAKTGPRACPFNSLYWDFMERHRAVLSRNPRIGMIYKNWDRQPSEQRAATLERAAWIKEHIDEL